MRAKLICTLAFEDHVLDAGAIIENEADARRLIADGVAIALEETAPKVEKKRVTAVLPEAKTK